MKVPHNEGIASHIDPESCVDARKDIGEALTGERMGQVLSRESLLKNGVPTASPSTEGNTMHFAKARSVLAPRGLRP